MFFSLNTSFYFLVTANFWALAAELVLYKLMCQDCNPYYQGAAQDLIDYFLEQHHIQNVLHGLHHIQHYGITVEQHHPYTGHHSGRRRSDIPYVHIYIYDNLIYAISIYIYIFFNLFCFYFFKWPRLSVDAVHPLLDPSVEVVKQAILLAPTGGGVQATKTFSNWVASDDVSKFRIKKNW